MSSDASSQYLRPGTVVDGYEIQYELGRGAMAIVYLAKQLDLDRPVAFKVLSASLARDKDYVTRFFNEARAAAALSHPSIIQAYKAGITAEGLYYFCMEYVEGETLLDMINENQRVPILQSLTLMTEVAEALEYGWQRYKFTHGDIKPENIMVNMQGKAKLADFGLAKVEGHDYAGNDVMLTPLYAAPELIRSTGNKSDCRSDIYAFGATLYHAIAGTPPFPGNDAQEVLDRHVHENPEPLSNRYQPTPQLLSNLVDRMLIKDPNKRIQNWTEIVAGLRSVTATLTTPQKKKLTLNKSTDSRNRLHQKPQPPQKKGSLLYWIIAAFFTLLLIAMAIILKTSKSSSQKQQPAPLESKLEAAPIQEISLETQQQPPPETAQVAPPSKEIASEKKTLPDSPATPSTLKPAPPTQEETAVSNPAATKTEAKQNVAPEAPPAQEAVAAPAQEAVAAPAQEAVAAPVQEAVAAPAQEAVAAPVQEAVATPVQEAVATPVQEAAPAPIQELPFELSKEYLRKEAIVKAAQLLAKLRYDITSSSVEPMVQAIDKWQQDTSFAPETKQLLQFVSHDVLPSLAEAKTSILANKDSLVGQKLKNRNQADEVIAALDFDAVKLTQTTRRGTLDRNLTWEAFRREGFLVELCKLLLEQAPQKLNSYKPYLAVLLFCGQAPLVANYLKTLPATDSDTLRNWFILANIQRFLTPSSKGIIELMDTLRHAYHNANDYLAASAAKKILAANNEAALLSDADQNALAELLDKLSYALPEIQAGKLARKAKELQMQAQYNASLNAALTAFFRFGRAKFPEKNTLDETIKGGFDKLPSPIELRKGSLAHSIPFCNHFPPAHNLVLCRDAATTFESAISQQAMESLLPLARFAVGDWSKTNAFLTNDKPLPSTFDKAPKEAQEAATFAILFAKSLSEARFSESPIGSKTFEPFVKKLQHPVPPDAHTMQLLSSAPLMLYGLKAPEKLPVFTSAPNLEQQVLTTFNYDGTIQAKRTVFYQCFTLILECSPSEHFKASLQDKLQDTAFLNGYGFPGSYKRFLERLVNLDSNSAAFPLDHIIDKELDWAFLRAWFASANTAQGLPDNADANMLEYLDEHAPYWPLQGGETIMAWLLARCTYCLHDKKLENAIQLSDTVLAKNYTCLISHYPALLALSASLKALSGKQGGIQTAAELLQAAPISPKLERAAFRALADLQPQFTTAKFNRLLASLPKHKEYTFWLNLMGISIAYGFPQEPAPTLTVKTTPSQALLAKAFLQFTQK